MIPGLMDLPVASRYQTIIGLYQRGQETIQDLATRLGVGQTMIKSALAWGRNPTPFPPQGRPYKLSDVHKEFIRLRTESDMSLSNASLARELSIAFPELGTVSETVVGKCRKELKFFYLPMRPECDMPESKRAFRVWWCTRQLEIGRDWKNVVFSDESWFEIGQRKRWVWRRRDDYSPSVCYSVQAHPKKVMIWGAVGYNFKSSLHFVEGSVTGEYYYDKIIMGGFLDEADRAFGHMDWILQQDNARPHIRRDIIEAMKNTAIKIMSPWPAYSPDLNIIERVWAIMKRRVDQHEPETIEDLRRTIVQVWDELTPEMINSLVDEMPRRLVQVQLNNGHTIQRLMADHN
jgi:hypothetical protein